MTKCFVIIFQDFSKAFTTALTLRLRKSVYVWPVPTNTIGWPVSYVIDIDAPTYQKKYKLKRLLIFQYGKKVSCSWKVKPV